MVKRLPGVILPHMLLHHSNCSGLTIQMYLFHLFSTSDCIPSFMYNINHDRAYPSPALQPTNNLPHITAHLTTHPGGLSYSIPTLNSGLITITLQHSDRFLSHTPNTPHALAKKGYRQSIKRVQPANTRDRFKRDNLRVRVIRLRNRRNLPRSS